MIEAGVNLLCQIPTKDSFASKMLIYDHIGKNSRVRHWGGNAWVGPLSLGKVVKTHILYEA